MLNRRTWLAVVGTLAWPGCSKAPELPPASSFLKDFKLMDRDGNALPSEWNVSQANPIDPTIQFQTVDPPSVFGGRRVQSAETWLITVDVRDEHDESRWAELFQSSKSYGEEMIYKHSGPPIWESPDVPTHLPKAVTWQWCHCRVPDTGRFTLVVKLYPTAFGLSSFERVDYGEGIELARKTLIVEPGQKPEGTLVMSIMNGESLSRTTHRQMRTKHK